MKFKPGDMLPTTVMEAVTGEAINLPGAKRLVHLQFRRLWERRRGCRLMQIESADCRTVHRGPALLRFQF